jgi:acid phosphatase (class A)
MAPMKLTSIVALALIASTSVAAPPKRPDGYLAKDELPAVAALLPGPPAEGSEALTLDRAARAHTLTEKDSPRWVLAQSDADIDPALAARLFDCPLGTNLGREQPPALTRLFTRVLTDVGALVEEPKARFMRKRPFMDDGGAICVARREDLAKNGSYPSGHAAAGYAWALVMAEIAPDQAGPIIARGRAVGDSRVVCGVHYISDVEAGRSIAAALVAAEHAKPEFRADLEAARAEVAARRATSDSNPVCTAENAALATPAY